MDNVIKATQYFGTPIGKFPELDPNPRNPRGTVFWASSKHWNHFLLMTGLEIPAKISGQIAKGQLPFAERIPGDDDERGYLVIIADD